MKPTKILGVIRVNAWVYLTLITGVFFAWLPLLGRSLPVADDFAFMRLIDQRGIAGYVHSFGFYRPLGHYLPIWIFLKNPIYHPVLVVLTHLLSAGLLFHVCQSLFGGIRLPLAAALIFAMFPFGYEAMTWVCAYNYVISVPFFLANLLLLTKHPQLDLPTPALFCLSSLLALLTALGNESLLFATVFSGLFVWMKAPAGIFRISSLIRGRWLLSCAPLAGCVLWVVLFETFKGADLPKHISVVHPATIFSVYYREYSLLDIFVPWFSPVTRNFVLSGWNHATVIAITICFFLFLAGLIRMSTPPERKIESKAASLRTLVSILALLFGASLIYAIGGGFSLDSRKKYPLVILLLQLGAWFYRVTCREHRVSPRTFLVFVTTVCGPGAMTAWLMVGIWKHETACYTSLADFLTNQKLSGDIQVRWNPDLNRAWPQMSRTLGYRFDDTWVLNLAVKYRGGEEVNVKSSANARSVQYHPATSAWILGTH